MIFRNVAKRTSSVTFAKNLYHGGISTMTQWRSQPKNFWGAKMFDFRLITLISLVKRLSKHKMTMFSKNLGGHGPFGPPGYAYAMTSSN